MLLCFYLAAKIQKDFENDAFQAEKDIKDSLFSWIICFVDSELLLISVRK